VTAVSLSIMDLAVRVMYKSVHTIHWALDQLGHPVPLFSSPMDTIPSLISNI
jgi:hypothetical protein